MGGSSMNPMGGGGGGGGGGNPWGQMFAQISADVGEKGNFLVSMRQNDRAADDLTARQNQANQLYQQLYGDTETLYKPDIEASDDALAALMRTYGRGAGQNGTPEYSGFEDSADYQFARDEGIKALDRSAASRGRLYSGSQMNALSKFNQGLATQHLDNYRRGLWNVSNRGLQAKNALTGYRAGYSGQMGAGINALGDISASERLGVASINDRYNQRMQSIWLGGGNNWPSSQPSNESSYPSGNRNALAPQDQGGGQSSYNWGDGGWY